MYDALNVLMAMDIIIKDKKDISWKGLPSAPHAQLEKLREERAALRQKILNQQVYLQACSCCSCCLSADRVGFITDLRSSVISLAFRCVAAMHSFASLPTQAVHTEALPCHTFNHLMV